MARVKGAMMTRKRRNKTLKLAKGYWGNKSRHFKMANEQVMKSLTYAQPQDAQRDGHQRSRRFHQARRDREERLILFAKKHRCMSSGVFLFSAQNVEKIITTERGRNA